jgi:hypothetical protein
MGETKNAHRVLVGKYYGLASLGRLRHRWENHNKMDFKVTGWEGLV